MLKGEEEPKEDEKLSKEALRQLMEAWQLPHIPYEEMVAKLQAKPKPGKEPKPPAPSDVIMFLLEEAYLTLTDGAATEISKVPGDFKPVSLVGRLSELTMVDHYFRLRDMEARMLRNVGRVVEEMPLWDKFLKGVRGIGPTLAGALMSEIDIAKALYPSSVWAYAGYDVAPDGKGRSRRAEHLVPREYRSRTGEMKSMKSLSHNPWLKTKLYIMATVFLKMGGSYRDSYDQYKHRITTDPGRQHLTKAHVHNMALRYMVKLFLTDYYKAARADAGLPIMPSYHEAKHGHVHRRGKVDCQGASGAGFRRFPRTSLRPLPSRRHQDGGWNDRAGKSAHEAQPSAR